MYRILLICGQPYEPWRGASIRVVHTIDVLTYLGYHVELLTVPSSFMIESSAEKVHLTSRFVFRRLGLLWKAFSLALKSDYDIIHGLHEALLPAGLAAWISRTPLILERHEKTFPAAEIPSCGRLERRFYRSADTIIGSSASIVALMQKIDCAARVCHIPDIPSLLSEPETAQIARAKQIWTQGHNVYVVVCLGGPDRFVGMDSLRAAMCVLAKQRNDIRFVWVGGSVREISTWKKFFSEKAPELNVNFAGRLMPESLAVALAAADVIYIPKLHGADAPMKLLDALFSGSAVLTVDCESSRKMIAPGMGVQIDDSPEAIAEALVALCEDSACRKKLGRLAKQGVVAEHSPDYFADAYRRCCAFVINRRENPVTERAD